MAAAFFARRFLLEQNLPKAREGNCGGKCNSCHALEAA